MTDLDPRVAEASRGGADDLLAVAQKLMRHAAQLNRYALALPGTGPNGTLLGRLRRYVSDRQPYHEEVAVIVADMEASASPEVQTRREKARQKNAQHAARWEAECRAREAREAMRQGPSWSPGGYERERMIEHATKVAGRLTRSIQQLLDDPDDQRLLNAVADAAERWDDDAIYSALNGWPDRRRRPRQTVDGNVVHLCPPA